MSELTRTDGLDKLWEHARTHWHSETVHSALLEFATDPGLLSDLAGRYRSAHADPELREVADRQLKKVAALAMAQLSVAERKQAAPRPRRWLYLVSLLFALGTAWLMLRF